MAVTIDIAQAGPLQAAIQKKLAEYGYSSDEDDTVMAEYVTVMLANSKSSAQITAELSDLIGAEYDAGFTDWIFNSAIPEHYTKSNGASAGSNGAQAQQEPATSPSIPTGPASQTRRQSVPSEDVDQRGDRSSSSNIQTVGDSRDLNTRGGRGRGGFQDGNLPNRPQGGFRNGPGGANGPRGGGGGVFGNAMSGVKREGDSLDRPNRRPRMSGERENGGDHHGGRSIFDRAGVRAGNFPPANGGGFGGPQHGGFAPPQVMQQAFPQIPGLPPLVIPDNFSSLPFAQQQAIQQQIFQHQLIAAAAAQQMYMPPGGSPPPVQQQQLGAFGAPPQQQMAQPVAPAPRKPVKLPPRPTSEELCKYGVDCKNAICRYSHPSPAASKESGLVLSKEVCDKGLQCEDKDCPRSHVSPAQKTDPEGLNVEQYKQKSATSAQPVAAVAPVAVTPPAGAIQAANPGAKPCMFGSACTRAGCFFSHPQAAPAGNGVPCKFGLACTRADCYFSHPPGQRRISAKPPQHKAAVHQKNASATFSPSSSTTNKDGLEGKENVGIDDSKMSARMKRFMEQGGERERIIPGSGNAEPSKEEQPTPAAADEAKDDVEVVV